jgi:hypothetical protein
MKTSTGWLLVLGMGLASMGCGSSDTGPGFDGDAGTGTDSGPALDGGGMTPDPDGGPSGCTPRTCAEAGKDCGPVADGCGNLIECGTCEAPETCGGGGEASVCGGAQGCVPATCEELGKDCGHVADGCGSTIQCGTCTEPGEGCGNGGEPNVCGAPEDDPDDCPALRTCEDVGAQCGTISNGCGGTVDCNPSDGPACPQGQSCGGGGVPNQCGTPTCTALTCEEANPDGSICGAIPDGCGGLIEGCGQECEAPESCGGGGMPGECGYSENPCIPASADDLCADEGACGPRADGCGGTVDCDGCTGEAETCGGGGEPGICGAPACEPLTCESYGPPDIVCGEVSNGCGDMIDCGGCEPGESCGGTGAPNICGDPGSTCEPLTCADQGIGCGFAGDGCGEQINCGDCPSGQTCGGGGTPSQCGAPDCDPLTIADCDAEGVACGPMADGCGGVTESCGSCSPPAICGGGGVPSQCGGGDDDGSTPCTGLCEDQVFCDDGGATTVSGTVYAPNGQEPLFNAVVYVPNAALPPITDGVSCDRCEDEDLGEPLVSAISAPDGSFELRHVPADTSFPLVIKMGKWRRVVTIPAVDPCTTRELTPAQTRLPRNKNEGHIPHIAVVTGAVDALECVLYKAGLDESEFTRASGDGRVHLYRSNGAWADEELEDICHNGCHNNRANNWRCTLYDDVCGEQLAHNLYRDQARLDSYDLIFFGCDYDLNGSTRDSTWTTEDHERLMAYGDKGGRLFLSHYTYEWLSRSRAPQGFRDLADYSGGWMEGLSDPSPAWVDTSFARGDLFYQWLDHVGATHADPSEGHLLIHEPRTHIREVHPPARQWVYTTQDDHNRDSVQSFTFNMPVDVDDDLTCGRGVYSAFHVVDGSNLHQEYFPNHCSTGPLTPQEKVLLFMMFDLAACVSDDDREPPPPPTCTPRTCGDAGATCGLISDGCGSSLPCGTCPEGEFCIANECMTDCTPQTCAEAGAECGYVADGCGGTLECGSCPWPEACGARSPNQCDTPQCTPRSCEDVGAECGYVADGCGDTVHCGTCPSGTTCGGDGVPNQCGAGSCMPQGCDDVGAECGWIGDGCGGQVDCGECPLGQFCGGDGVPNVCGGDTCPRRSCGDVGAECGLIGDGCGGVRDCGDCPEPTICGGDGVPNVCGGGCAPLSCQDQDAECGMVGDGCGELVECGECPPGQTCGGDGIPNQCGDGPGCTPQACEDVGAECGLIGDGCGDMVDCGDCPGHEICGGGGVPYECGGGCEPLTCAGAGAECGQAADGCGDIIDCGGCPANHICQPQSDGGATCTFVG